MFFSTNNLQLHHFDMSSLACQKFWQFQQKNPKNYLFSITHLAQFSTLPKCPQKIGGNFFSIFLMTTLRYDFKRKDPKKQKKRKMMRTTLLLIVLCVAASMLFAEEIPFCATPFCTTVINAKGTLVAATLAQKEIVAQNISAINTLISEKTLQLGVLLAKMQEFNATNSTSVPQVSPTTQNIVSTATSAPDGEVKTLEVAGTVTPTTTTSNTTDNQSLASLKELISTLTTFLCDLKVKVQAMVDAETNAEIKLNLLSIWERIVNLESTLKLIEEKVAAEIIKAEAAFNAQDAEQAKKLQAEINDLIRKQEDLTAQYNKLILLVEAQGTDTTCTQVLAASEMVCCVNGVVDRRSKYKSCSLSTQPLSILCPEKIQLSTQIATANSQITGYQYEVATLDAKITDQNKGVETINKEIVAIQASIPTEEQKCSLEIQGYSEEMSKLKSEVLVLEGLLGTVQNSTDIVDKKPIVDLIRSIIASFLKSIADSEAKFIAAKIRCSTGIDGMKTQIVQKQAQIDTINATITNDQAKRSNFLTLISYSTNQVNTLTTHLNTLIPLCGN